MGRLICFKLKCSYCEKSYEYFVLRRKLIGEMTVHSCVSCEEELKFRKNQFVETFKNLFQTSGSQ